MSEYRSRKMHRSVGFTYRWFHHERFVPGITFWTTRVLEVLAVAFSLLWALEANAQEVSDTKSSEPPKGAVSLRKPAAHGMKSLVTRSWTFANNETAPLSSLNMNALLDRKVTLKAPDSLSGGPYAAPTVKNQPNFVYPVIDLAVEFRVPTAKGK